MIIFDASPSLTSLSCQEVFDFAPSDAALAQIAQSEEKP
jgi:hypothetical protein